MIGVGLGCRPYVSNTAPTHAAVATTAARWAAKNPELAPRMERAVALVANVTSTVSPEMFMVEGSYGHQYVVRVNRAARTSTCTCPDHGKGHHCKHRLAVALYVAAKA